MEANKAEVSAVIDGDLWLTDMYAGHRPVYSPTTKSSVRARLGKSAEVIDVPSGTTVTFFRPYDTKDTSVVVVAIFLDDEQITLMGGGRLIRKRHNR